MNFDNPEKVNLSSEFILSFASFSSPLIEKNIFLVSDLYFFLFFSLMFHITYVFSYHEISYFVSWADISNVDNTIYKNIFFNVRI